MEIKCWFKIEQHPIQEDTHVLCVIMIDLNFFLFEISSYEVHTLQKTSLVFVNILSSFCWK